MERQKGALLDLDRIKNERLLRFQKLQSLHVGDQNSCKQIRKVKAGICKIQKAHKLEADTNTNKITNKNKETNTNKQSCEEWHFQPLDNKQIKRAADFAQDEQ